MKDDNSLKEWGKMVKSMNLPEEKFELSYFRDFDLKAFLSYVEHDKKKIDKDIRLVLVKKIGFCYAEEIPMKDFKAKITSHADFTN
jgi:3-dehydroquinate synthetase